MKKKHIADVFLVIGLLVLTVIISIFIYKKQSTDNLLVEVSIDGKLKDTYYINLDTEVLLPTGNKLVIKDEKVFIEEANCPDKLCIRRGFISRENESIICLPNKLVVRIVQANDSSKKENDTGLDVIQWLTKIQKESLY